MTKLTRALWNRRLKYRERKLHHWRSRNNHAQITKWTRLVSEARAKVTPAPSKPIPAKGIDVSNLQGAIDWPKVKAAGYRFAWVKAGEGDWKDPDFLRNVKAAKAAGLKVGAYHFLRPKPGRSGAQEAAFFIARLREAGLGKGDLKPAADVEATKLSEADTRIYAWDFLQAVRDTGRHPVLYTYPSFVSGTWGGEAWWIWPLWLADYDGGLNIPKPWKRVVAHQHSSKGRVPGIHGDVDLNRTDNLRELIA